MARQYFNTTIADPPVLSAGIAVTPSTTATSFFTGVPQQQQLYLPLPFGTGPQSLFVGQAFRIAMGGTITTPATGTLIIDCQWGPGSSTTAFSNRSWGASAAQTVTASLSSAPWRIEADLVIQSISLASVSSTSFLTGVFSSQGTLATAGGGWTIPFGGTVLTMDSSGLSTGNFGAINFTMHFSVTGGTITTFYTSMQQMN